MSTIRRSRTPRLPRRLRRLRRCRVPVRTFPNVFKGTPSARQAEQPATRLRAGRGASARASAELSRKVYGRAWGLPPCGGAARRFLRVATLRRGSRQARPPPHPTRGGTSATLPMARPAQSWRPSSSRQPSCRRAKITVKGARCARVADAMGASAHP